VLLEASSAKNALLAGLVLLVSIDNADGLSNVRKDEDLPALHMSYADLQLVIQKSTSVAQKANGAAARTDETLMVSTGDRDVVVEIDQLTSDARLPTLAKGAVYGYRAGDDVPVTSIWLEFSEDEHSLTVAGHDSALVDALYASLRSDLSQHSVMFAGSTIQWVFTFVLPMVFGIAAITLLLYWSSERRSRWVLLSAIWCAAVVVAVALLPLDRMLARFLLTSGNPSIWVRYGPQISGLSLLLGLLGIAVPFLYKGLIRLRRKANTREPADKRECQYLAAHSRVMKSLARRSDLYVVRNERRNPSATGDLLFDGIITSGSNRIALSTFRSSSHSNWIRLFVAQAAGELHANRVQTVVVIFFRGERAEELRFVALEQLATCLQSIRTSFQVLVIDPEDIDADLTNVAWAK
jgi:hypothetical protein